MAKRVQRYRVSSTVMSTLVGLTGELIVNLTNNSVHVHDGVTANGFELARVDASNMQNATTGQNGRMTAAHVTQLNQATADIAILDAALDAEILARIAGDTALDGDITLVEGRATNLELGKFALNTEPVLLSFYQNTIPTGWTLNTAFDDRVPIVETTQAEGGNTGGSWTISGLAGTQPPHTHTGTNWTGSFTDGQTAATGGGVFARTNNTTSISNIGGTTSSAGGDAVTVTHTPGWRPNFVKILVLSRSSWSA